MALVLDNPHLSRPTEKPEKLESVCAINCTNELANRIADLVASSISVSTRRAYQSDLAHFAAWGGTLPAGPATVAAYLAAHANVLSVATLVRRAATISKAHEAGAHSSPCRSEIVKATLRGIKRTRTTKQRQARPLVREDLFLVLDRLNGSTRDVRDRALLLLGFAGGFRRSELVALDRDDIEEVRQGLVVTLRSSKTDQEGTGRRIGIPHGRTHHCPVTAVRQWLEVAHIDRGPAFRPVDRHGRVIPQRLSGEAVALIARERAASAGLDPDGISGHSLRSGLATSAAQAGVPLWRIRQQTGHASDAMLSRYIREAELFSGNAAGVLL